MIVNDLSQKPIRSMQDMLRTISYYINDIPSVVPDGIFGKDTKKSVIAFQKIFGLTQTGDVNADTWEKIRDGYMRILHFYAKPKPNVIVYENIHIDKGEDDLVLYVIQAMLLALSKIFINIPVLDVSGIHDEKSVNSVTAVQDIFGIEPTGIIDTVTSNMIGNLYASNIVKKIK